MGSPQTNSRERVALAQSDEPAAANENPKARMNIIQRMAAVRAECDGIGKQDIRMEKDGKSWTIKGHTVEAVLSEIRPLLAKHGVGLTPNLVERTYAGNRCDVIVDFRFEALDDTADRETVRWGGCGTDNGDKAFSKAGTNATKEMLKKVFLVTDRDDAKEETESVEHQAEGTGDRRALEAAQETTRQANELWAKALKMGFEKATSVADVTRLERDNKVKLTSPDLPAVTRTFFAELIHKRKTELQAKGGGAAEEAAPDRP